MPLTPRTLARAQRPISPILWHLTPDTLHNPDLPALLSRAIEHASDAFLLSHTLPDSALPCLAPFLPPSATLLISLRADQLRPRSLDDLSRRLASLNRSRCAGLWLADAAPAEIKSGGPFHRLFQMRDRGLADLFFVEADDYPAAEWMVDQTPAHAICLPYGPEDQRLSYRLADAAAEAGVALIAKPVATPPIPPDSLPPNLRLSPPASLAFQASHPAIASVLLPLPSTQSDLDAILSAVANPLPAADLQAAWALFQPLCPPPSRPRGNHPPEFAS